MLTGFFSSDAKPFSTVALFGTLMPSSMLATAGAFLGAGAFFGSLRMRGCVSTIMNALLVIASRDRTPTTRQGGRNGLRHDHLCQHLTKAQVAIKLTADLVSGCVLREHNQSFSRLPKKL